MTPMNVGIPPNKKDRISAGTGSACTAPPALLFEMMRSFITLARTLNLSNTVKELNTTRQTVRRHIAQLEGTSRGKLFQIEDRHYQLTTHGNQMLPEAQDLVARGELWVSGNTRHINELLGFSHEAPNGWSFYQQQQPLSHVWNRKSKFLARSITAWSESRGHLEDRAFAEIRPYVLVYRDTPHGWLCVEIGERSFYAEWLGWKIARSSVGKNLGAFPGGPEFESLLNQPFNEVKASGGIRLDEVVTQIPREPNATPVPLAYQRLLLGGRFPDDSFALIAVVDRSEKIRIDALDQTTLERMPADATVSFFA